MTGEDTQTMAENRSWTRPQENLLEQKAKEVNQAQVPVVQLLVTINLKKKEEKKKKN